MSETKLHKTLRPLPSLCAALTVSAAALISAPAAHAGGPVVIDIANVVRDQFPFYRTYEASPVNDPRFIEIGMAVDSVDCSKAIAGNAQVERMSLTSSPGEFIFTLIDHGQNELGRDEPITTAGGTITYTKAVTSAVTNGVSVSASVSLKNSPGNVGADFSFTTTYNYSRTDSTMWSEAAAYQYPPGNITLSPGGRYIADGYLRLTNSSGTVRLSADISGTCTVKYHQITRIGNGATITRTVSLYDLIGPKNDRGNPKPPQINDMVKGGTKLLPKLPDGLALDASRKVVSFTGSGTFSGTSGVSKSTQIWQLPPDRLGLVKGYGGKCVTPRGQNSSTQLGPCGSDSWRFYSDGTVRTSGGDKCLGTVTASWNGAEVRAVPCNGTVAQQWRMKADGSLYSPAADRCLDDYAFGTNDGAPIVLWECNGFPNQKWMFV
ncbi:ricin-type beta-trefoil lectin domain protein (plasmid) [Kitasatospora sp. NBC_00070]|uniref:ricin-type beta-trefoil lectin domain protein n=1 Tax=Kitasatospora sp. NBC_00070 TaxID=2975962 RepID=UPI002F9149AE